jgi:hypothetical protein
MVVVAMWFYFVLYFVFQNNDLFICVRLQIGFVFVLVLPYPMVVTKKAQNQSGQIPDPSQTNPKLGFVLDGSGIS